jgi:hypothetical protein
LDWAAFSLFLLESFLPCEDLFASSSFGRVFWWLPLVPDDSPLPKGVSLSTLHAYSRPLRSAGSVSFDENIPCRCYQR